MMTRKKISHKIFQTSVKKIKIFRLYDLSLKRQLNVNFHLCLQLTCRKDWIYLWTVFIFVIKCVLEEPGMEPKLNTNLNLKENNYFVDSQNKGCVHVLVLSHFKMCSSELQVLKSDVINSAIYLLNWSKKSRTLEYKYKINTKTIHIYKMSVLSVNSNGCSNICICTCTSHQYWIIQIQRMGNSSQMIIHFIQVTCHYL